MIADCEAEFLSAQENGSNIEGSFITILPGFGLSIEALAVASDFDDHLDQIPFFGIRQWRGDKGFNLPAFYSMASFRHWFLVNVVGNCGFRDRFAILE